METPRLVETHSRFPRQGSYLLIAEDYFALADELVVKP
jgi:hypothetical protein